MAIYYVETTIPSFYHEVRTEPEMVAERIGREGGLMR